MKARTYTNNENKNTNREEQPVLTVSSYSVKRARTIQGGIVMADVEINGITIYGMKILANKSTGDAFLAWPSTKGKDGKYYSVVYARISDGDQEKIITKIYEWLDANT
jgi:hypothetical protein